MSVQKSSGEIIAGAEEALRQACARLDAGIRHGSACQAEEFLSPFSADPDAATELIYAEFCARSEVGPSPPPQEYYQRFPHLRARLERQFRIHELLEGAALDETGLEDTGRADADSSAARRPHGAVMPGHRDRIGRYEILHELGRGAMGVVFAARHMDLERTVALKVVPLGPRPDSLAVTRFRAEAKTLATLQHPHIVQIYDLDVAESEGILAMELVGGGSLAARIAARPQSPQWSASLLAVLARAVGHAHSLGVVHRDLKPGNVLLTEDGAPKIVDFGLARCVTRDDGHTTTGAILGTPSYMAPEQAAGEREVSAAADIYALGAILYDLLTGRPPFQGQTPLDTLQQVLCGEPVPPSRLVRTTPRDLETICLKCLDKEPPRRYQSADELADDLERFSRHEPILARPLSPPARAWRWCRRRPWQAGMIASLAMLGVVVVVGSWLTSWRLATEQENTQKNLERALAAESQSRAALWESLVDRARAGRWSGRAGQRFDGLAALATATGIAQYLELSDRQRLRLRNEAIACLAQADLQPDVELPIDRASGQYSGIAFDSDLRRVAHPARDGGIIVRALDGKNSAARLPAAEKSAKARCLKFSPNDRYLAAHCSAHEAGWGHAIYDVASEKLLFWIAAASATPVDSNLDFDAQSAHVVATHRDGSLRWYELPTGAERRKWLRPKPPRGVCISPDQRHIALWRGPQVEVVDIETEKTAVTFRTRDAEIHHLAWSRSGRFLAGGAADHCAYIWDVSNRSGHRVFEGHQGHVAQVAFDAATNLLAATSLDGTTRLWDVWTGQERVAALGSGVQFSRDGQRLGFGLLGNAAGNWRVAAGPELQVFQGDTRYEAYQIAAHPRRPIAASFGFSGIRLWDIERGRQIAVLPGSWMHCGFDPRTGDLIASGEKGVYRAVLSPEMPDAEVGLITELSTDKVAMASHAACYTAFSADGATRLSYDCMHERAVVTGSVSLGDEDSWRLDKALQVPSISPDGRWLANKPQAGGIEVWQVRGRRKVAHLLDQARNLALEFSPDGRWLVTGSPSEYVVWETGSWKARHRLARNNPAMVSGHVAFAPDGRMAALAESGFDIKLVDPQHGVELATLPSREGQPRPGFCFSHDGRYLVQMGPKLVVQAWDLKKIRGQLREMQLDW